MAHAPTFLFGQIENVKVRFCPQIFNNDSRQIHPLFALIQNDTVAGGDDTVGFDEVFVGILDKLDCPVEPALFGEFENQFFEPAGVGDGFV